MPIYYPDGNGGRITLSGGTSDTSQAEDTTSGGESSSVTPVNMSIYYPDGDGGRWLLDSGEADAEYSLPTASESVKGGVKIGTGVSMEGDFLNVFLPELPVASSFRLGGVKIGSGLSMAGETVFVVPAGDDGSACSLPTASNSTKGGVKVGSGLAMDGEVLNVTLQTGGGDYTLPTASNSTKGGVKIGSGLAMNGDTLNVTLQSGGGGSATYSAFTGATSASGGAAGLVPAPRQGEQTYFLRGDGTWVSTTTLLILDTVPSNVPGAIWLSV